MQGSPAPVAVQNPFAQDLVPRPVPPTSLVICGVTGDLAARKLLPAVYELALGGHLPDQFNLVGVARGSDDGGFVHRVRDAIATFARDGLDEDVWKRLIEPRLSYLDGDLTDAELFRRLHAHLDELDGQAGHPAQRLVYLAVAPTLFGPAARSLGEAGLARGADPAVRVMVEKPFGRDLESARKLDAELHAEFDESQVLRVDHYLGKETVQNLLVFRFGNGIFEPVWNRRYVDHVEVTVAEELGIGHRADYYDRSGALRDVIQNHALQLLSLVAMAPDFAGGVSIGGSGRPFVILQTILLALATAALGAAMVLRQVAPAVLPRWLHRTDILAVIGIGLGGALVGQGFYGLSVAAVNELTRQEIGAGAGAWLIFFAGLFVIAAAIVTLIIGRGPALPDLPPMLVWIAAGAAGGALLVAIGSGLSWYKRGGFSSSGLDTDTGKVSLSFAIITILVAAVPVVAMLARWGRVGRIGLWSLVGLGALLFGITLTGLTTLKGTSAGAGLILSFVGALAVLACALVPATMLLRMGSVRRW